MKPEIILNPFQDINGNTYWDSVASGDVFIMAFRFVSPLLRLIKVVLSLVIALFMWVQRRMSDRNKSNQVPTEMDGLRVGENENYVANCEY